MSRKDGELDVETMSRSALETELEDAREELKRDVTWGNCRRGCPPAYLNRNGYCSPACELGAPRGEFVTVKTEEIYQ